MAGDLLKELNELRIDSGIDESDYQQLIFTAFNYQKQSEEYISSNEMRELIIDALSRLDSPIYRGRESYKNNNKSVEEAFDESLRALGYKHNK